MEQEIDPRVKKIWEIHLDMEIGHLHDIVDLYKKAMGDDPADFLPRGMPAPLTFESNIEYLRQVLEDQVTLTADGTKFVPVDSLRRDHRYYAYQSQVNGNMVPSQDVIKEYIGKNGQDYRFETAPHPVPRFRIEKQYRKIDTEQWGSRLAGKSIEENLVQTPQETLWKTRK